MKEKTVPNRINEKIIGVNEVRLVGNNVTPGIYSFKEAYKIADDLNLDLVEINGNQSPIICKILDYEKFLYEQKRKEKDNKQKPQEVKEIRFGPQTDEHDFQFKLKHAISFLKERNKVKAYVQFRGRELNYKDQGELLLLRFISELEQYGKPDKLPVLDGKKMFVLINPK